MPDVRISLSRIPREISFWILFLVTIGFFCQPLFLGETFFFRDLYNHFYPQKKLFSELVLSGQLPLWDPYRHGGQPFLANMNNSVLYPTNLLYLILPPITAFNIDIVLHVLLAALSAYTLARVLGLHQIAATVSGLVYAFSGPALSVPNVWLYAPFHLPLIFLFWHLYCLEQNRRWFVLAALVGMIQVFTGRPEMPVLTLGTLLVWTLVFPYPVKIMKRFTQWLLLGCAILAAAAIQLIPMVELIQNSSRSKGVNLHIFFAWSVHPNRYPELVFPGFLGSVYSVLEKDRWGLAMEELSMPYMLSLYFGIPTLLLATLGGLNKKSDGVLPRQIRILLLILIIISFLTMAGRFVPGFRKLIDSVPWITVFRYPVKLVLLSLLPIALLSGFQLQYLMEISEKRHLKMPLNVAWILAGIVCLSLIVLTTFPSATSRFLGNYFSSNGNVAQLGVRSSIFHAAAVSILIPLSMSLTALRNQPKFNGTIALIIGFDLLLAGRSINHFAPREFLSNVPELAKYIKKEIGEGKFYRTRDDASAKYRMPSKEIVFADRWRLEMLSDYTASMYGIPVVFHEDYDRLEAQRMEKLTQKVRQLPWERQVPILSSAGVRFVLSSDQIQAPGLRLVRVIKNPSNKTYFLYRNQRCSTQAFFVANSVIEHDSSKILNMMSNPDFDPCKTFFLEEPTIGIGINISNATVRLISSTPNSSSHEVITDKPGFLVFSEPYSKGWRWTVNGWRVQYVRANFAFSAVAMPAGKNQVVRTYCPASFVLGSAISLISLFFLFLISIIKQTTRAPDEIAAPA